MILFRKIKTVLCIIARCTNWPELAAMRLGFKNEPDAIHLRNGLTLFAPLPLRGAWDHLFTTAIADIYAIRNGKWDVIIDAGSYVGEFSVIAAFYHPEARITAFEPNPGMESYFKKNIKINNLMHVELVCSPLTGDGREVVFSVHEQAGCSSFFLKAGENTEVMKSQTLDMIDFTHSKSVFFKLHCEGAEGEVIEWICRNVSTLPSRIKIACKYHSFCPVAIESTELVLMGAGFVSSRKVCFGDSYLFAERGI